MIARPSRMVRPSGATAAVVGLLLGALLAPGCAGKDGGTSRGKPKPAVAVEAVRTEPLSRVLALTGETVAVESAVVSATVEGPIRFCPWREGDHVEATEDSPARLVEIDRELYRAEVRAAEAALAVARAKLEDLRAGTRPEEIAKAEEDVRRLEESAAFLQNDLDRIAKLVESGSLPSEVLEKARVEHVGERARLDAARRQLEMLRAGSTETAVAVLEALVGEAAARLDLAKARLAECTVWAPFAGTVMRVFVRPGDMASPRAPLLEIADLGSLVVRMAVPEANAADVREGLTARVRPDALPGRVLSGKVVRVFPDLDRTMRTRTVEVAVEEPAVLLPGMFARIELDLESVPEALIVPDAAIVRTPAGGTIAYVVDGGRASLRKVRTGIRHAGRVQILEGLVSGEAVVVTGHGKLREGMEVHVVEPSVRGARGGEPR